jgi:formiminotetrahydrofolate cyclodeaminase
VDGEYVYQTKTIKAQSRAEAEQMIREAFLHLISKDSEIFVLSEDIIH